MKLPIKYILRQPTLLFLLRFVLFPVSSFR